MNTLIFFLLEDLWQQEAFEIPKYELHQEVTSLWHPKLPI